ncbi:unnamed protein product [Brugia pahangi]|uniref:Ovule protein n=1 Tax=Brugia pahangi TaxID=6280 RepID=A0A0N4TK95_BRUPA|nr:unnamed protein product [Brugia pahangi]
MQSSSHYDSNQSTVQMKKRTNIYSYTILPSTLHTVYEQSTPLFSSDSEDITAFLLN